MDTTRAAAAPVASKPSPPRRSLGRVFALDMVLLHAPPGLGLP